MDNQLQFCTVEEAVEEIRQGRMIIVTDDPGRENEADLIIAAEFATPEAINFMVTHARGLVCAPLSPERADALQLPLMTSVNRENMSTAFTVSVDAAHDITTGISAAERSLTIRTLADPKATVNDFVQPGHTFPLRAVPGGVLRRAGHTEATIDLVRMAGLQPAGVCCEIMKEDGTMDRAAMATITNHDDLAAVEAALRIKDATGCKVVVVSMGPPPAEGMLRELLAMGCDEAVLVSAREFGGSDTYATSQILAAAIKKVGVDEDDIVFCGRQAIDGDTAQVGPQIAEKLHLPQVSYVAEIAVENKAVTVKRLLEDGYMTIKVQTPCLLTCVKELNDARYMSVGGIMECYNKPLEIYNYETLKDDPLIDVDTIGLKGSPTNVYKSFSPPVKGAGMMMEGADKATVEKLVSILNDKHII